VRVPKTAGPIKYAGGKSYLASKIVALLPPHRNYVEPYFGGGAVLFAKNPADTSEVVNDLNADLVTFWRVLQDPDLFEQFRRQVEATPFSEMEWELAGGLAEVAVVRAWAFFVRCRQSLAGRMDSFAPISTSRLRRGQNEQASAWWGAVEGLGAVHERLKRVVILNRDALAVIRQFDKPDTVTYCDPPYFPDTRTSPNVYRHEMTREQHGEFLEAVLAVGAARVAVSGYRCDLYDEKLKGWNRHDFDLPNNAAGGKSKRRVTESLWVNW
jgi:DNA adenine methylase